MRLNNLPLSTEFYQLLRSLEITAKASKRHASRPVGYDYPLEQEFVAFRVSQSLAFPHSAYELSELPLALSRKKITLNVNCFGLTGPSGVLPSHYTELLNSRIKEKDNAFRTLLDSLNARAISFLYRAWTKSRIPLLEESSTHESGLALPTAEASLPRSMLKSYTGLLNPANSPEMADSEDYALYFSGFYSQRPRNASSLQAIVSKVLCCCVSIHQFRGRWFELDANQVSSLGGKNSSLGSDFVIGTAVFEGAFSLRLKTEALSFKQFQTLKPGRPVFKLLERLVHLFLGTHYWVDLQVVLKGSERPPLQLAPGQGSLALGQALWLSDKAADRDVEDTIFELNR